MQLQERSAIDSALESLGIKNAKKVYWNLSTPELYEHTVRNSEGFIAKSGALVVETGVHTGRSPRDKFIVREASSENEVDWKANVAFPEDKFDALLSRVAAYLQNREIYVADCFAGADPNHRLPVRVVNEIGWHNLFAQILFFPAGEPGKASDVPESERFTIVSAPNFYADPAVDGTRTGTFIILNFARRIILIGGTSYAGEMKKSIFSTLNFMLPRKKIFPMHCSANVGPDNDVAIFFGLSGTGKTTLSADAERSLIGDDETGWSDEGVFNFENGCYAKVINLSEKAEPEIYVASQRFGSVLENVVIDPVTYELDLDDESKTENTRAAYPIAFIPRSVPDGMGVHPKTIIFLTADAFGVMPAIARLTPSQAMYHFLSGYTALVAGTEKGVTEPTATFSTCFGHPFMVHPPSVYANLLGEKIARHGAKVWLVNTGWQGGPYGIGKRISIGHTRAIVRAALKGELDDIPTNADPVFGVHVPVSCPGVPDGILQPRNTWADKAAYDAQAAKLAGMFVKNFEKYAATVTEEVRNAGPRA